MSIQLSADLETTFYIAENYFDWTQTERALLRYLLCFYKSRRTPFVQPRRETLAEKLQCSTRTISRAIKRFVDNNILIVVARGHKGNRYIAPECVVNFDWSDPESILRENDYKKVDSVGDFESNLDQENINENLENRGNGTIDVTIGVTIPREYNYIASQFSFNSNDRDDGHVHKRRDIGAFSFFKEIGLGKSLSLDASQVFERWRGFKLADGTMLPDYELKGWLKRYDCLAIEGALMAYQVECKRRREHNTATKDPGVSFLQWLLVKRKWIGILRAWKNRFTALKYIKSIFRRVTWTTAHLISTTDVIDLQKIPADDFELMVKRHIESINV